ncbi:MAG: polysulfide reductase NrfD [Chloroflexi bacterium]|nr:polysulfide reductase NrfD [Chloroflexota bacterium]
MDLQILVDALMMFVFFFGRVGIPLLLVLTIGYWIERKLRDGKPAEEPRRPRPAWFKFITRELDALPAWLPAMAMFAVIGVAAGIYRLVVGLGASTNLNQAYPWGLWIGFDLFMVAFSGGAFTLATLVYIFQMHHFHAAIRPTVLTGLLGYISVLVILFMDLGRWDRFYHFVIYPNINSALFEVSWCILLYTTVLVSEFSPVILERIGSKRRLAFVKSITIPLVIIGSTLSTLHQSSLGSLFVIISERLHPLWYSPIIPLQFYISSIAAGLAMVVGGATVSFWVFKRSLKQKLVGDLASFLPWVLGVYLVLKLGELLTMGEIEMLWTSGIYSVMYAAELIIGVAIPIVYFALKRVQASRMLSLIGAAFVLFGILLNRFDVAWFALRSVEGYTYWPSPIELAIQVGVFAGIITVYTLVGHYLPLFEGTLKREEEEKPAAQEVLQTQHA